MADNPNDIAYSKPTYLSRRMQIMRGKTTIYKDICNFEEKAVLVKGTAVTRPYRSQLVVKTLGEDGSYTRQAITDTPETLTINQKKVIAIYVTDVDAIQSNYNTKNLYADDAMRYHDEWVDGDVLGEYANASSVVGAYEIAGTGSASDGIGFTLSVDNIDKVLSKVRIKMKNKHIPMKDRWAAVSQEFFEVLIQRLAGKDSALGDKVGTNPNEMGFYGGFRWFVTEGTGWSAVLSLNNYCTEGDTIVINGVTFTAMATPETGVPGSFDIENSAANQAITLAKAINNSEEYAAEAGAADLYFELTEANRKKMSGIVATASTTYVLLKGEGVGYIVVSKTTNDSATVFVTGKQIQHNLFGQGKPIDVVIQKYPNIKFVPRSDASYGYVGEDMVSWQLYGLKTFKEGADTLVDVQCRCEAY